MTTQDFEHIARMLRPQIMRVAWDFFRQTEEAEDVVQEVMMKLWMRTRQRIGQEWMSEEDWMALAIKATKNQCVSNWRKQKRRQAETIDDNLCHIGNEMADTALLTEEERVIIDRAICRLPRSEQRMLRMKQNTDLSSDEIAVVTGVPVRSVRTILSSARRNLLKLLKQ